MKLSTLFVLIMGVLISPYALANTLTPEQALNRLQETTASPIKAMSAVASSPTLVYTVNTPSQTPGVYVFNIDNGIHALSTHAANAGAGFLVLSADDCAPALLGYSATGTIDADNIPDGLKYWLNEYARQIEYQSNSKSMKVQAPDSTNDFEPIEPLTTTQWNQSAPYNNLCPMDNGERSVTGCVATAMAQVMKYHNWPAQGQGSNSYSVLGTTLTVNFGETTYDWNNMLDIYTTSATEAQNNAVATLMYSCGVSVNMDYTSGESGASAFAVPAALVNHFGYDAAIQYLERDYYRLTDWQTLIYNNLANIGPVQYSGQNNEGGHSFVCDGYESDGYFHINWGWGGMSNGYFLLTALDPDSQGIGGSTAGYNYGQSIILGVQPSTGTSQMVEQMLWGNDFTVEQQQAQVGGVITLSGPVYNMSISTISGQLGAKIVPATGSMSSKAKAPADAIYAQGPQFNQLGVGAGYLSYQVSLPSDIEDGTYTMTPAFMNSQGEWVDIPVKLANVQSATMTVSNGIATFTANDDASIHVNNLTAQTPFYIGSKFELTGTLVNTGTTEYYGNLVVGLVADGNQIVAIGDDYNVDLGGGETADMVYISAFSKYGRTAPTAGEYSLGIFTADSYELVSDLLTINLEAAPSSTAVSVTDLHLANGLDRTSNTEPITFIADVTCTGGYFADDLTLAIFPQTGGQSIAAFMSPTLFLNARASQTVEFTGDFSNSTNGETYMAGVYQGQNPVSSYYTFKIDNTTGVAEDAVIDLATATEYYNLQGMRLSTSNGMLPGSGVYIVVSRFADGTSTAQRVLIQ